jgi:lipopolysaccharide/colanic/teichoic acid biosynthesis glycosyltransferase
MVMLDLYYIAHWKLQLDLKIVARTVPAMVKGDGAY